MAIVTETEKHFLKNTFECGRCGFVLMIRSGERDARLESPPCYNCKDILLQPYRARCKKCFDSGLIRHGERATSWVCCCNVGARLKGKLEDPECCLYVEDGAIKVDLEKWEAQPKKRKGSDAQLLS